jgi:DNA polymerase (family 10)
MIDATPLVPFAPFAIRPNEMLQGEANDEDVAHALERVANLLAAQGANPFRVNAFRRAAQKVRLEPRSMADILDEEGVEGLEGLPGIGKTIARAIRELLRTGRLRYLDRLEGQTSPEELFTTIPGIGPRLARRIHNELHLESLEDLEVAAHDGRLEMLPGLGSRRAFAVREVLDGILGRASRHRSAGGLDPVRPNVQLLLDIDNDYRAGADLGALPTLAPKRFNPNGEAWLPILHEDRDGWHLDALFSNSARAHHLRTTHDWVVIHYEHDEHDGHCTVVTETHGKDAGRRVIRGREPECRAHYEGLEAVGISAA